MTSSLASLKEDIKLLEKRFSIKNKINDDNENPICFQLISANLDEIVCEFIDLNKKKYRINANIPVS
jgi:hypothetical protein